jgi:hypothetical protein
MRKFKVGDRVTIKKDLKEGGMYETYVNDEMEALAGHEVTITTFVYNSDYKIDLDGGNFYWSEDMFEEIDTPTIEIPNLPTSKTLLNLNVKIELDPNSLKEVEEQIKTLQDKLNNLKLKLVF